MSKGRKTTFEERVAIVSFCLEHDRDYIGTVREYGVSYEQIYSWVRKYERGGADALIDRRGRRKPKPAWEDLTETERLQAENRLLKAEIEELKLANRLLKKWQFKTQRDAAFLHFPVHPFIVGYRVRDMIGGRRKKAFLNVARQERIRGLPCQAALFCPLQDARQSVSAA